MAVEFPEELLATPFEDTDPFYVREKTLILIAKADTFSGKIHSDNR